MSSHDLLALSPLVLASLVPALLGVATFFVSRRSPFTAASIVTILTAGLSFLAVTLRPLLSWAGYDARSSMPGSVMHFMAQLDVVSSAMLVLVSTLVLVVVRYSRTYLAGENELDRYTRSLLLTVAAVTVLVLSNHLALLMAAWFATSVCLHQLLTFYRARRQALIVAHKKFLLSRLADACFISSLVLVGTETGSLRIDVVNAFAQTRGSLPPSLHLATVLLVFGVLLKSAQLPFHGWMQQVMEAPTPVSALLHAGVVNIGGFVMIRLAPLMAHASVAQSILVGVGLVTSIVASLVMTTRVSYKVVLAWSTIGQMGFMLVQCGLGAWHLALMHVLAHSVYKGHSFLSSGTVVESWRKSSLVQPSRLTLKHVALGAAAAFFVGVAPFYALVVVVSEHPSASLGPLAIALGLSFAPMLGRALAAGKHAFALATLFTVGAGASYFGWHAIFDEVAPAISVVPVDPIKWLIVLGGLFVLFVAQTVLQISPEGRFAHWLQPHLLSGLYIDDWFTRVTFRLWPPRLDHPTAPSSPVSAAGPQGSRS